MCTLKVTNIEAADGTSALTIANSTGIVKIPGHVIQIVGNTNSTYNGGASAGLSRDDTIPQQSEVHMCVEVSITPRFSDSKLFIQASIPGGTQNNTYTACCLFQDSNADAIQVMPIYNPNNNVEMVWALSHYMTAGTTSATTFKIGLGSNSGAIYQNGVSSSRRYGGVSASTLVIMEIAQ